MAVRAGLPRPAGFTRNAWRKALLAANSYRGHPVPVQRFLEAAFSDWATTFDVVLDPSRPTELFSPGAEFTQDLVGRTVRINGTLYKVTGPPDLSAHLQPGEVLELCPIATAGWAAADWSGLFAPESASAEFHAFLLREDQAGPRTQLVGDVSGTSIVYVWPEVQTACPPSWLLEAEDLPGDVTEEGALSPQPASNLPEGMEPQGWIMALDEEIDWTEEGGPTPLFLGGDDLLDALEIMARQLLAVGFKLKFRRLPDLVPSE